MARPRNILIIRNDKLGDFMLAYPTFNAVKKLFPSSKIFALVPDYTKPMAELCQWIDEIIIDDATEGLAGLIKTTSKLKHFNFDAALCLHSSPRIALSLLFSRIPHRFAPASRIDQIFYNHRLTQRRSRSEKPEFEYNIDLVNFMGEQYSLPPVTPDQPPYLALPKSETDDKRQSFLKEHQLEGDRKIIIVHAGSGGSAINLSIKQYAELITLLSDNKSLFFILTAGPGEEKIAKDLSALIEPSQHSIYISRKGLKEFTKLLAIADAFISGSTGVLHIAGSLNTPTVAFYPDKISATALRWQTSNDERNRLAFTIPYKNNNSPDLFDINSASKTIKDFIMK